MSSLHESTDPAVRYLWERAEERDNNGETEVARALVEAARHIEGLARAPAPSAPPPVQDPPTEGSLAISVFDRAGCLYYGVFTATRMDDGTCRWVLGRTVNVSASRERVDEIAQEEAGRCGFAYIPDLRNGDSAPAHWASAGFTKVEPLTRVKTRVATASGGLDTRQLAREFYATAVAHTRSQDEADEAVDRIIQRLDDVLLGIGLGRRNR